MKTNKKDAIFNKLLVLFPTDLAKKLYREYDKNWLNEHANEILFPESEFDWGQGPQNKLQCKTVAELRLEADDEEVEFFANEVCCLAVSHWQTLMHIVNTSIGGPVVLSDMLVPVEEKISIFHKELATLFADWNEALDTSYYHFCGKNSEQGKQLACAFASNLRAEIDKNGKLYVTDKLVIVKEANRYILERKM